MQRNSRVGCGLWDYQTRRRMQIGFCWMIRGVHHVWTSTRRRRYVVVIKHNEKGVVHEVRPMISHRYFQVVGGIQRCRCKSFRRVSVAVVGGRYKGFG